jgi:tetratricopeptide (TPR) repeat protein
MAITPTHPPVPNEDAPIPMQNALDAALAQARQLPASQTHSEIGQWLNILRHTLPYPNLWAKNRDLLLFVLESLNVTGRISDMIEWLEIGIARSEACNDPETAAKLRLQLGRERIHQGDTESATHLLDEGADYFTRTGIVYPPALNSLAFHAINKGQWAEAKTLVDRALEALPPDAWAERAQSYRNLGIIAHGTGQVEAGLAYFQESLRLWKLEASPRFIAFGLVNVGTILRPLERYTEAESHYLEAIAIFEEIGDTHHRAIAQSNLGNVYLKSKQWEAAIEQYHYAEQIFAQSRYRLVLARIYNNWGMAYAGAQKWKQAVRAYLQSIVLWTELGNLQARANDRDNLGLAYMALGEYELALTTFRAALDDLEEIPTAATLQAEIQAHVVEAEQHLAPSIM